VVLVRCPAHHSLRVLDRYQVFHKILGVPGVYQKTQECRALLRVTGQVFERQDLEVPAGTYRAEEIETTTTKPKSAERSYGLQDKSYSDKTRKTWEEPSGAHKSTGNSAASKSYHNSRSP
jgi:hypothetical protein